MFEFFKGIILNNKVRYLELQEEKKRIEFQSQLFEKEKKILENKYLDALKDDDESNWKSITAKDDRSLTESDMKNMRDLSYQMYYQNGHFKNIIRLFIKYIVGRGFSIIPDSSDPVVKEFWEKICKINKWKKRIREIVRRKYRDGEVFIRSFKNKDGTMLFRFMDPSLVKNPSIEKEINKNTEYGIESNPDDVEEIISYWYNGEQIDAEEVIHDKLDVDSDVKRGRPKCEPIMEDLSMYKGWMRDRMKLNKIRNMIGLVRKVSGTPTQVETIAKQNQTNRRVAQDGTSYMRTPEGISIITASQNIDYEFKTPNLQASDVQNDGRALLLGISAGVGLPEFMVTSDASNSNYSSTMIAESPGVQEFIDGQEDIEWVFQEMFYRAITWAIECKVIPEKTESIEKVMKKNELTGMDELIDKKISEDTKCTCRIVFPEIVHRDILQETNALSLQKQEGILSKRTFAGRVDLDYDEEQEQIKVEEQEDQGDEYDKARNEEISKSQNDQNNMDQVPNNQDEVSNEEPTDTGNE